MVGYELEPLPLQHGGALTQCKAHSRAAFAAGERGVGLLRATGLALWGRRAGIRHSAPTPVGCRASILIPTIGSTHRL